MEKRKFILTTWILSILITFIVVYVFASSGYEVIYKYEDNSLTGLSVSKDGSGNLYISGYMNIYSMRGLEDVDPVLVKISKEGQDYSKYDKVLINDNGNETRIYSNFVDNDRIYFTGTAEIKVGHRKKE